MRPSVLRDAIAQTIVGQREVVEALVLAVIADAHVLLEGMPGVAKTLACRALASAVGGTFRRIQFTPDLLPSDIVGTRIFDQRDATFSTVLGPIFGNVVLADEINRAPAKVQSALLEGMQERRVTIGGETHAFPKPFIVLATMNPFDSDGTYALPLAQLDRFALKILVGHPSLEEERAIVDRFGGAEPALPRDVVSISDVLEWQTDARAVHVSEAVRDYALGMVRSTRSAADVAFGASPRASLALISLARARALLDGRSFVTPDDVRDLAPAVLRHRVGFDHRLVLRNGDPETVIAELVRAVQAP